MSKSDIKKRPTSFCLLELQVDLEFEVWSLIAVGKIIIENRVREPTKLVI